MIAVVFTVSPRGAERPGRGKVHVTSAQYRLLLFSLLVIKICIPLHIISRITL